MTTVDVPTAVHIGADELPNRRHRRWLEAQGHSGQGFQMYGANLNLDADGNVDSVVDGAITLAAYYMLCEAEGLPRPNVLVG